MSNDIFDKIQMDYRLNNFEISSEVLHRTLKQRSAFFSNCDPSEFRENVLDLKAIDLPFISQFLYTIDDYLVIDFGLTDLTEQYISKSVTPMKPIMFQFMFSTVGYTKYDSFYPFLERADFITHLRIMLYDLTLLETISRMRHLSHLQIILPSDAYIAGTVWNPIKCPPFDVAIFNGSPSLKSIIIKNPIEGTEPLVPLRSDLEYITLTPQSSSSDLRLLYKHVPNSYLQPLREVA